MQKKEKKQQQQKKDRRGEQQALDAPDAKRQKKQGQAVKSERKVYKDKIWRHILSHLDDSDLLAFATTCKPKCRRPQPCARSRYLGTAFFQASWPLPGPIT